MKSKIRDHWTREVWRQIQAESAFVRRLEKATAEHQYRVSPILREPNGPPPETGDNLQPHSAAS